MVAGHLRERRGIYQIVLSYTDENGKRQTPSRSTGLPVKGNKRRAEAMLQEARKEKELELERLAPQKKGEPPSSPAEFVFSRFMLDWPGMMENSVDITTFSSYNIVVKNKIIPYFDTHHPGLRLTDLTPKHIQEYYTFFIVSICIQLPRLFQYILLPSLRAASHESSGYAL